MPKSQQLKNITRTNYKSAELSEKAAWYVVFYVLDESSNKYKRFRQRVPKHSNLRERRKIAKQMIDDINYQLYIGWNPLIHTEPLQQVDTINQIIDQYLNQLEQDVKLGVRRIDTLRTYKSNLKFIREYCELKKVTYPTQLNRAFILKYLDWKYKSGSATLYNNHQRIWSLLLNWMRERNYVTENFAANIPKKKRAEKKRKVIPPHLKNKIHMYLSENNKLAFLTLCMVTYYCFIRGTELTRLRVKNINLKEGFITIPEDASKNRKTEDVTVPKPLREMLKNHISDSPKEYFIFSDENFIPGPKQMHYKKIPHEWDRLRKGVGFGLEYQFYSLKDTGISDTINAGIPLLKVRDQARHHDLKITQLYTPRTKKSDDFLANNAPDFFT